MVYDLGIIKRQKALASPIAAIGGTVSYVGSSTIHTFTSTGVFKLLSPNNNTQTLTVSYLVVGGGGSGGRDNSSSGLGGGGGAGGLLTTSSFAVSPGTAYTISVGAGGTAISASATGVGNNGSNSAILAPTDITYSGYFNGNNYLNTPSAISLAGDFTIEGWFNTSVAQSNYRMLFGESLSSTGAYAALTSTGVEVQFGSTGGTAVTFAYTFSIGYWYHFALVRSGSTINFFINGVNQTLTNGTQAGTFYTQYIGVGYSTSYKFNGYISNFRIVNGLAVYTAAFTPLKSPLTTTQNSGTNIAAISTASYVSLLTLQNSTFIDNSVNNLTITPTGSPTTTSTVVPPFGQTAIGGGGGAAYNTGDARSGGSGGGGDGTRIPGSGTVGQGFAGGAAFWNGTGSSSAGGGGGAGAVGTAGTVNKGGNGGVGLASSISGVSTFYAGGGGGSSYSAGNWGVGGTGGGGKGGVNNTAVAVSGTTNTGGGGGGGSNSNSASGESGSGGSGVVIISYPNPRYASTVDNGRKNDPYFASNVLLLSNQQRLSALFPITVDYLVVAGGGGGGGKRGGGGGAGGLLTGSISTLTTYTSYAVSVGTGGAGTTTHPGAGQNGTNTVFGLLTAIGGGGGGSKQNGVSGGSGGGGGSSDNVNSNGGSGTVGQGNAGGNALTNNGGAGGGGASSVGANQPGSDVGGAGGTGAFTTLISTTTAIALGIGQYVTATNAIYFAGGGGGGPQLSGLGGAGGIGGGGSGGYAGSGNNSPTNTGGGGGGGGDNPAFSGGNGGSGVVLLRVSDSYAAYFSSGITAAVTTATGYNIYAVTSGTGTVLFGPAPTVSAIPIDYLIVAGGGGGGANDAAGGGAGGVLTTSGFNLLPGFNYAVAVGAGGAGGVNNAQGVTGNNSAFNTIRSFGGGGGGRDANSTGAAANGLSGGSGGGGGGGGPSGSVGGSGVAGQGNAGGAGGGGIGGGYGGGGGGGWGAAGTAALTGGANGHGGAGSSSTIFVTTGTAISVSVGQYVTATNAIYFGGGGGGGSRTTPGTGGIGGGGGGGGAAIGSGQARTGSGGGGAGNDSEGGGTGTAGTGGSGVVVLRHLTSIGQTVTTTGGPAIVSVGSYTIYAFSSSGSIQIGNAPTTSLITNTNTSFIDSSANALTITPVGTPTQGSFSPFGNNWSNYFNGSSYLSFAKSTNLEPATNQPFTIETWFYATAMATQSLYVYAPASGGGAEFGIYLMPQSGGAIQGGYYYGDGAGAKEVVGGAYTANIWNHVSLCSDGSTMRLFLNGISIGTPATVTGLRPNSNAAAFARIGTWRTQETFYFNGHISNFRFVKGTALYTSNFTPSPTAPLPVITNTVLLTCASNRFMDKSGTTSTVTVTGTPSVSRFSPFPNPGVYNSLYLGGSSYFNGSSYLTTPTTPGFTLTADFTIDFWANMNSYAVSGGGSPAILSGTNSSNNWLVIFDASACYFYWNGAAVLTATVANATGEWMHWAISRSGSTLRIFKNGKLVGSTTNSSSYTLNNSVLYIGSGLSTGGFLNGYISNIRIVKNRALYTNAFTPPTTVTDEGSIANIDPYWPSVNFLINADSGSLVDRKGTYTLTAIGTTAISTSTKQFGAGSVAVLGGGNVASLQLVAGDITIPAAFTLDGWVYLAAGGKHAMLGSPNGNAYTTAYGFGIFDTSGASTNTKGLCFMLSPANGYSGNMLYSGQYPTLNTWTHFAIQRDSAGVWSIYMNGIRGNLRNDNAFVGSPSQFPANSGPTGSLNVYGLVGNWDGFVTGGNGSQYNAGFNGYLDDFRLTLGVARYSGGSFVPPTIDAYTLAQNTSTSLLLKSTNAAIYDATMNNNVITAGSTTLSTDITKINNRSMKFNGSSNLIIPTNPALNLSTGDFTIECWFYRTTTFTDSFIISSSGSGGMFFGFTGSTIIGYGRAAVAWDYQGASHGMSLNTWYHIALTRSGTSIRIFVNGVQVGVTQTSSQAYDLGVTSTNIGSQGSGYYHNGYIDDLRVNKGVARYTANFTPPTSQPILR